MYSASLTLVLYKYSSFLLNYWCWGPLDAVACVPHVHIWRNGIIGASFPCTTVLFPAMQAFYSASMSFWCKPSHTHKGPGMQQFPSFLQELLGFWCGTWGHSQGCGGLEHSLDVEWAADKTDFLTKPFDVYMVYSSNILVHYSPAYWWNCCVLQNPGYISIGLQLIKYCNRLDIARRGEAIYEQTEGMAMANSPLRPVVQDSSWSLWADSTIYI